MIIGILDGKNSPHVKYLRSIATSEAIESEYHFRRWGEFLSDPASQGRYYS